MAISGDALIEREYYDPETLKMIKITMSVKDHILFSRLNDIAKAIGTLK